MPKIALMKIRSLLRAIALAVAAAVLLPVTASAFLDGPGGPSPHDNFHLLVVRPGDFRSAPTAPPATPSAAKPELLRDKGAQLDGTALPLAKPVVAPLQIKHAGRYAIWLRVGVTKGFSAPLNVTLTSAAAAQNAKPLLETLIADGSGSVKLGGPDAFKAYAKQATSSGVYKEVAIEGGGKNDPTRIGKPPPTISISNSKTSKVRLPAHALRTTGSAPAASNNSSMPARFTGGTPARSNSPPANINSRSARPAA